MKVIEHKLTPVLKIYFSFSFKSHQNDRNSFQYFNVHIQLVFNNLHMAYGIVTAKQKSNTVEKRSKNHEYIVYVILPKLTIQSFIFRRKLI